MSEAVARPLFVRTFFTLSAAVCVVEFKVPGSDAGVRILVKLSGGLVWHLVSDGFPKPTASPAVWHAYAAAVEAAASEYEAGLSALIARENLEVK